MSLLTNLLDAEPIQGEYLIKFSPATLFIRERQEYYYELPNGADGLSINGKQQDPLIKGQNTFRICIEGSLGLSAIQPTKEGRPFGNPIWVEVFSYKFPTPGSHHNFYQAIVEDLFQQAANLPFCFVTDAQRGVTETPQPPTPLFTYYFLKENLPCFQAAIETVLAEPHRLLCDYPERVLLHEVSEVDGDVIVSILQSPNTWVEVRARDIPIANILKQGERRFAPTHVWQRLPVETFDTRENRFILNFFRQVLITTEMLPQQSWWEQVKELEESKAVLELGSLLRETITHPIFSEVGELFHIPFNSQVLMRREGYRELFTLWQQFHSSSRPMFDAWQHAIDVRSMHFLYELWVYFKLINEIRTENYCTQVDLAISDQDAVRWGSQAVFEGGKTLYYNHTFHPTWKNSFHSYSMVLRPDYFWEDVPKGRRVVLDAKFSMSVNTTEIKDDDEIDGEEARIVYEGNPIREDLYKMHTYRDALVGTNAAVIVYPGTNTVFMPTKGKRIKNISLKQILSGDYLSDSGHAQQDSVLLDGIGAIPMKPTSAIVRG